MQKSKATAAIEFAEHPEGVQLLKDGEEMLTPKRLPLVVPNQALAEAIKFELTTPPAQYTTPPACGGGKGGEATADMPPLTSPPQAGGISNRAASGSKKYLTQIAYTVIDLMLVGNDSLVEAMLAYLHTDTICYFAEAPELNHRERKYWQPIIDWASERFNCEINNFEGVMPSDQPEETVEIIRQHIAGLDPWTLTCLLEFTRGFSSLLLGLAVLEKRLDANTAFDCSQVDEDYQREEWGADEEAMERREKLKNEMLAAEHFLNLLL